MVPCHILPVPWALYLAGEICWEGSGNERLPQSYEGAVTLFKSAAAKGHPMSHVCLGQAYMFGDGVEIDLNNFQGRSYILCWMSHWLGTHRRSI